MAFGKAHVLKPQVILQSKSKKNLNIVTVANQGQKTNAMVATAAGAGPFRRTGPRLLPSAAACLLTQLVTPLWSRKATTFMTKTQSVATATTAVPTATGAGQLADRKSGE